MNGLRAGYVSGKELTDTMTRKKQAEEERFKKLGVYCVLVVVSVAVDQ